MELILQKQPSTSKFSGHPTGERERERVASPPSSSDSSCSDPDDIDEHWDSGETPPPTYYSTEAREKIPKVSSDHTISDCDRRAKNGETRDPKPRLSLGDVRASWREFSGKHFGSERGRRKKRHDGKDEG